MVVGASDIDLGSCNSSSRSSDEEENRHKGKRSSKNIAPATLQGFCGMAHGSASKKSNKDDSGFVGVLDRQPTKGSTRSR
jgi:hypothetical protein